MSKTSDFDLISDWVQSFLFDRKIRGFKAGTIEYHRKCLTRFLRYCEGKDIQNVREITPLILRGFINSMDNLADITIRNTYKSVAAFLHWYEAEVEPPDWRSPTNKVQAPKITDAPIQPIPIKDAYQVIKKCPTDNLGIRDRAILSVLLDTGIRAAELLALDVEDLNMASGQILIRHGKGDKTRAVYCGKETRRVLRRWLSVRENKNSALFTSLDNWERLTYSGLRWLIIRAFERAKVPYKGIHTFRRLFALTLLRQGVDVVTISRLLGHSTTEVVKRYLAQTDDDLHIAHAKASPVDNGF